jgi:hypothetical protein
VTSDGRNAAPVADEFLVESIRVEHEALDRLPKRVRLALVSARYEYSAVQMFQVFEEVKRELTLYNFGVPVNPDQVWDAILPMIKMNDDEKAQAERRLLDVELPAQFAAEKRARIEAAFKRAS